MLYLRHEKVCFDCLGLRRRLDCRGRGDSCVAERGQRGGGHRRRSAPDAVRRRHACTRRRRCADRAGRWYVRNRRAVRPYGGGPIYRVRGRPRGVARCECGAANHGLDGRREGLVARARAGRRAVRAVLRGRAAPDASVPAARRLLLRGNRRRGGPRHGT